MNFLMATMHLRIGKEMENAAARNRNEQKSRFASTTLCTTGNTNDGETHSARRSGRAQYNDRGTTETYATGAAEGN
jgi:hypothetical protein